MILSPSFPAAFVFEWASDGSSLAPPMTEHAVVRMDCIGGDDLTPSALLFVLPLRYRRKGFADASCTCE